MADDSALSPDSREDFLGRAELQSGSISFKDARKRDVEISVDIERGTKIDLLSESGDFYSLTPEKLAEKWSDIKDGFDPRTSLNFLDSRGNQRSLLLRASSIVTQGDTLIIAGDTVDDARILPGIGLDEIVGDDAISKSNQFINDSDLFENIRDIDFSFDTFKLKEFRRRFDRFYDQQLDGLDLSRRSNAQTTVTLNGDRRALRGRASMPAVPLKFNNDFLFPGSQVGVNTRLEGKPIAEVSYYTPEIGHDLLDPKAWGLDLTFGFDLSGSVALLTGKQNGAQSGLKGAVPLADVYKGPVIPLIDTLRVGPDLTYDLQFNLKGVPAEYRYNATFNPRATLNLNGGGMPEFRGSGSPVFKAPSIDPITGISMDAKITPGFTVQYDMELKIPLLNRISSSLKGSIVSPATFSVQGLLESRPSASVSSNAFISFDGTLFEGTPFMSKLNGYRGDIYDVKSSLAV